MATDSEARRARFKAAADNRATQAQGNFSGYEKQDPVDYVSMEVVKTVMKAGRQVPEGKPLQLRFVGGMEESNPRVPGDMKRLSIADAKTLEKIETLDDLLTAQNTAKATRKFFQIIFPDKSERRTHPLWKLVDAVLAYDWDDVTKKRVYHHEADDLLPLFKEFRYNGDPTNTKDAGMQPGDIYMMNCIDRAQMDWHRANKKTLVLSRGSWMSKDREQNEVKRYNTGTKKTVYDALCNNLVETYGFYEDYDVITWRVGDTPWYHVVHAKHGFEAPFWEKAGFKRLDEYLEKPLTEEELSWELWDFDKYFKPTSATRLLSRIGYLFKIYDECMVAKGKKSNLWEELKVLAEAEKVAREAANQARLASGVAPEAEPDEDRDESNPVIQAVASVAVQPVTPTPVAQTATRRVADLSATPSDSSLGKIPWAALADGTLNGTVYKGIVKMTNEEKARVLSVNPDGSFTYSENLQDGTPDPTGVCTDSGFRSPLSFKVDPLSGLVFES